MLNIKKIHFRPGIYQTVFGFKGHRTEMFALFFYPCLDSMSFGLWQGLIDMLDCCCSLFNNRCLLWRHLSTVLQILNCHSGQFIYFLSSATIKIVPVNMYIGRNFSISDSNLWAEWINLIKNSETVTFSCLCCFWFCIIEVHAAVW